jgi:hypothetical protein
MLDAAATHDGHRPLGHHPQQARHQGLVPGPEQGARAQDGDLRQTGGAHQTLRLDLGAHVVVGGRRQLGVLADGQAVGEAEVEAGRGDVHQPADAVGPAGGDDLGGAGDVGAPERLEAAPGRGQGGAVDDGVGTARGLDQGLFRPGVAVFDAAASAPAPGRAGSLRRRPPRCGR